MARTPFKLKSSPTKGKLGDFFKSVGENLKKNKKGVDEMYAEKKSRKAGESKFQADVRKRKERNKANKADAAYYGSAEDKAKNSETNRIKTKKTVDQPKKSFGDAFKTARKEHGGDGGTFTWEGNLYTTDIAK